MTFELFLTVLMVLGTTGVGLVGTVSQCIKNYRRKSVEDLSLSSWCLWVFGSVVYLLYAIFVNPAPELILTSVLDVSANGFVLVQILIYRKR